jgi:hypothetical protein
MAASPEIWPTLGESRKAIEFYEQQVLITQEIGDRRGEGIALYNMAISFAQLGESTRAIGFGEQSLSIHQEIGDPWAEKVRAALDGWREKAGGDE